MNASTLAVMESVELYIERNAESPSLLDLKGMTGMKSTAAVNYHLRVLINSEFLAREKYANRGLQVLRPSTEIKVSTKAEHVREPNGRISRKARRQRTPNTEIKIDITEMKRIEAQRDAIRMKRLREENAKRREGLDERMDRVVAEAKARESSKGDPFYNSAPLFQNSRVCGQKVG